MLQPVVRYARSNWGMIHIALALALPIVMAGLFATWNWTRRSRHVGWAVLGVSILGCLALLLVTTLGRASDHRLYAAILAMYLFSGLMWAWWFEGLKPGEWDLGEVSIAIAAVGLFSLANTPL